MAERDSWAVGGSIVDQAEARLAIGALVWPGSTSVKAKTGFRPGPADAGLVTATGTPDGFVHVAPFQLFMQDGRGEGGTYIASLDAIKNINILSTPANATNPRNDLIIAQQNDTFYGDGDSLFTVKQVVGTPAGSPSDPTVTGSSNYVLLARVRVDANATTIVSGKITDLRPSAVTVALGGILPVASATVRNTLSAYEGMAVWRKDTDAIEVYDGAAWQQLTKVSASVQTQFITAGTTYTPPAGAKTVKFRGRGAGGGGGGCANAASGQHAKGGGGGQGGYSEVTVTAASISGGVAVGIGTGGTGGATGAAGGAGGDTTVGSILTAKGGSGAAGGSSSAASFGAGAGSGGSTSGAVGDVVLGGAGGGHGWGDAGLCTSGAGGGEGGARGHSFAAANQALAGLAGVNGGGGGGAAATSTGTGQIGGAGGNGWVIADAYF